MAYPGWSPPDPVGYERRGFLFDVFAFGDTKPHADELPAAVTHCIRPDPADLDTAVFGLAAGAPRIWKILPTERYQDAICAEVSNMGFVSYFVPVAPDQPSS